MGILVIQVFKANPMRKNGKYTQFATHRKCLWVCFELVALKHVNTRRFDLHQVATSEA